MRLLSKTNKYYFVYTALLLSSVAFVFYITINYVIKNEIEEVLENELEEYLIKARADTSWLHYKQPVEFQIERVKFIRSADITSDTLLKEKEEDDYIPYLQLIAYREINGANYRITMRESLIESEEILFAVSVSMLILFVTLLVGLILLNNYLSRSLWKPFYLNLENIRAYQLNSSRGVARVDTDIQEFEQLNEAVVKMTERMGKDYLALKEFTENASHEIQTPLAVIKSKIDYLLQHVEEEKQLNDLMKIERAVNRISRTNQGLLLLTKIENNQFHGTTSLDIGQIIGQCLSDYNDFILSKELKTEFTLDKSVRFTANRNLVQILLNNLLSNAIKHNVPGGYVKLVLDHEKIFIENSGPEYSVNPDKLFERFYKGNPHSESPGLGLSIIKQICEMLNLDIRYETTGNIHRIAVKFPGQTS